MASQEHVALLKTGRKAWSNWRENNPTIVPDLSRANLSEFDLRGWNLSGANLRGALLCEAILSEANFQEMPLLALCANMTETSCVTAISEQGGKENQHGNDERFCSARCRCDGSI